MKVLLVLLRAVVAAREREDEGVVALQLAEPPRDVRMIGQLVVGERAAGGDVGAHRGDPLGRSGRCRLDELLAPSRAPCTASLGRSSVFDGMHAQHEHSPPTRSRSTTATRSPPTASAPAQCSPGEPPPSTITSYSLLMATSVADRWRVSVAPGARPSRPWNPWPTPGSSRHAWAPRRTWLPGPRYGGHLQAHARADLELGEHLLQMPVDGAGASCRAASCQSCVRRHGRCSTRLAAAARRRAQADPAVVGHLVRETSKPHRSSATDRYVRALLTVLGESSPCSTQLDHRREPLANPLAVSHRRSATKNGSRRFRPCVMRSMWVPGVTYDAGRSQIAPSTTRRARDTP